MIKLFRTHPRHLAGSAFSSPLPRFSRPPGLSSFGRVLHQVFRNQATAYPSSGKRVNLSTKTQPPSPPATEPRDFEPFIREAALRFGVEKNLVRAVIKAESNFNPQAESRAGAIGLMQLLPSTGRELGVSDLFDPRQNIMGGTRYLAMLLDRYKGNLELALAAYNWGPGNLERGSGGLPDETERYIHRVLRYIKARRV